MKKVSLTQKSSDIFNNRSELINFNSGHSYSYDKKFCQASVQEVEKNF